MSLVRSYEVVKPITAGRVKPLMCLLLAMMACSCDRESMQSIGLGLASMGFHGEVITCINYHASGSKKEIRLSDRLFEIAAKNGLAGYERKDWIHDKRYSLPLGDDEATVYHNFDEYELSPDLITFTGAVCQWGPKSRGSERWRVLYKEVETSVLSRATVEKVFINRSAARFGCGRPGENDPCTIYVDIPVDFNGPLKEKLTEKATRITR